MDGFAAPLGGAARKDAAICKRTLNLMAGTCPLAERPGHEYDSYQQHDIMVQALACRCMGRKWSAAKARSGKRKIQGRILSQLTWLKVLGFVVFCFMVHNFFRLAMKLFLKTLLESKKNALFFLR